MGKVGRPFKYLPDELETKVQQYKEWAKEQTFEKVIFDQKNGEQKSIFLKCPLTIQQFCLFIGISYQQFKYYMNKGFESDELNDESREINNNLFAIFAHVHEYIQQNQIAGALLNEYNGNLVARLHNITDKVEVDSTVTVNALPVYIANKVIDLTALDYELIE